MAIACQRNEKSLILPHIYGMHSSFLVYKPYGVLSQFTTPVPGKRTLGELYQFPKDVYPIGRLDEDSEGLLLLSNDPLQNKRWLGQSIRKEYWVQVEGAPLEEDFDALRKGVTIRVKKKDHHCLPADVRILNNPKVPERIPPIRYRAAIPDTWISISIREGKNRQVRKMTAKVGFPTLRLIRWRIGEFTAEGMEPGEVRPVRL